MVVCSFSASILLYATTEMPFMSLLRLYNNARRKAKRNNSFRIFRVCCRCIYDGDYYYKRITIYGKCSAYPLNKDMLNIQKYKRNENRN